MFRYATGPWSPCSMIGPAGFSSFHALARVDPAGIERSVFRGRGVRRIVGVEKADLVARFDDERGRVSSNRRIAASSAASVSSGFWRRHAFEQYRTSSQFLSHALRHVNVRPHVAHVFSGRCVAMHAA